MNIFDQYLEKIIKTIDALHQDRKIELSEKDDVQDKLPNIIKRINVDKVPPGIDYDISTNVALILAKINKKDPIDFANFLVCVIFTPFKVPDLAAFSSSFSR